MADYYNVTTNTGDAEIAAAIASNTKLAITHIAFGDGNGSVPTPNKTRTSLVREVHRQAVTKYERHPTNANWIVIETIIPSDIGGFTIREMGIIGNGKLISHGSHAPFEKVADPSGVSEYRLKFTQNITDGNVVSITLDDSLIYATQAWVEENFIKRNEIIDNLTTDDATKPVSAKQAKKLNDEKLSKSKNLSDLDDVEQARENLQLGNAAIKNTTSSNLDTVVGRILKVGDFGVGGEIRVQAGVNLNSIVTPGEYGNDTFASATTALNYPLTSQTGNLKVLGSSGDNDYKCQIYTTTSTNRRFLRQTSDNGKNWTEWSEFAYTKSTVEKAKKLETPRAIALSNDLSGSANFDGSTGINISASLGARSLNSVGYKVIGDLVLQWGQTVVPINSTAVATLPIAVSNILQATGTYDYPSGGTYPTIAIGGFTTTSLTIGANASTGNNYTIRWFAICKL